MKELKTLRTINSKTFKLDNKKEKIVFYQTPIHYPDKNGAFRTIDLTPVDKGDYWLLEKTFYTLKVQKNSLELTYESDKGGKARTWLESIDNKPLNTFNLNVSPEIRDNMIYYPDVLPDLDLYVEIRSRGVEWFKIIKNAYAPHTFEWGLEKDIEAAFEQKPKTIGHDNKGNNLEALTEKLNHKQFDDGTEKYTFRETLTKRTSKIVDKKTRRKAWTDEIEYPLVVDVPDFTETIGQGNDDGYFSFSSGASLSVNIDLTQPNIRLGHLTTGSYSYDYRPTWRFPDINLPYEANVTLAEFKVHMKGAPVGSFPTLQIAGFNTGNVLAFTASQSMPRGSDVTTAKVAFTGLPTSGPAQVVTDVTSIVQEIVNRGDWWANNDMAFLGVVDGAVGTNWSTKATAYEGSPITPTTLEITYETASSGSRSQLIICD